MTERLVWNDSLKIGHAVIDEDHRRLVAIANDVIGVKDPARELDTLKKAIHALADYMKGHFDREEAYQAAIGFKQADEHKAKHQAIIAEMNAMLRTSRDMVVLRDKLISLVKTWVMAHIVQEDMKMKPAVYE